MKKWLGGAMLLLMLLALWPGRAWGVELPVQAEAALLMEKETGQVLYAKNEHQAMEPASVTKVMTLLLVMEAIDSGTLSYDDAVTVSAYAASMGGSQIFLSEGESITVEDLLKGVCVSSGNDAAVALAEKTAGVTELFVERMNNRARELGMQDTHFVNCTGLPAEGHVTSAWDIAVMSRELIVNHPDIRRFTTIWMDTLRDGQFQLSNTNKLIRFYEGTTGLKTGSTDSARYCISATAEREGMELIAVVLKSPTGQQRFEDAKTLLNYGFSTYGLVHASPEEPLPPVPVQLGAQGTVQPRVDPAEGLLLAEKSRLQGLEQTVTLPESAEAPVRQGDVLGTLTVTQNGETVLEVPIRAAETVEKLTFGQMLLRLARTMCFCG
jgi:D-alanyl-D-alanine carboxypeptidase (penicillin-binding protein 5/6)